MARSWIRPQNASHYLVLGARWLLCVGKAPRGDVEVLSSVGCQGGTFPKCFHEPQP